MALRRVTACRASILVAAALAWSCGGGATDVGGGSGDVATIVVTPPAPTLAVGTELPLQASVQDATGKAVSGVTVIWTVQDANVARVSSSGVVTALAVGTTQVAANANGKSGIAAITVQKTPVATVAVLPKHVDLTPGAQTPLTAVAYDAAQNVLAGRTTLWTSSNELVATVDDKGMVTATGTGAATVTATVDGKSDAATVSVTQAPVATLAVTPNPLLMSVGQSTRMSATAKDANGFEVTGRPVTWSSSSISVASIAADGMLTANAAGTATITATVDGVSAAAAVTISNFAVGSVSVQPPSPSVIQGASVQLTAVVRDVTGAITTNRAIGWSSSNSAIATVSSSGVVTGVAPGTATITATSEGQSGSTTVTVTANPVASVTVQPPSTSITAGQTAQLTATVKDANGVTLTGRTVAWSSNNTAVATVAQNGVVTAVAAGAAIITATSEGKSGTSNVTVLAPLTAVGSVTIQPTTKSLTVGQTATFQATVKDATGKIVTDRPVTWTTSDAAIATVSDGLVTATGPGTATITATSEDKSGTATVVVSDAPVGSVTVSPAPSSVVKGQTTTLVATVKDVNGLVVTNRVVTWTSSNNAVATVSSTGVVTGVALGTATITATSEGKSGQSVLTVTSAPVASVTVSPATTSVAATQSTTLVATVTDVNGAAVQSPSITWASSNSLVATVSSSGVVTGIIPGTVTITATSGGKSGTAEVTVTLLPVATVTVQPSPASVFVAWTTTLTATTKSSLGTVLTGRTVTWSTSDPTVATVSPDGVVTGVAPGTATITATSEGKTGPSVVTVSLAPVATVTVSPAAPSLRVNESVTLSATLQDAHGNILTGRTVTWTSSNGMVASVDSTGLVKAKKQGTATITATSEGKQGSATVTVSK